MLNAIHLIIDYVNFKKNPPYNPESQTPWDVSICLCHKRSQKRWTFQSALNINKSSPDLYEARATGNKCHP